MSSDEEILAGLYARRQELLKELADINSSIRCMEQHITDKTCQNGPKDFTDDAVMTGATDTEKVSHIIDCCMRDSNGLRDAMKIVDACKIFEENTVDNDVSRQKYHFRNTFVHALISKCKCLSLDANGSELMQHALCLLQNGGSISPTLGSVDYVLGVDNNFSEILLLLYELRNDIPQISCDTNGTRVMQKLLDYVKSLEEVELSARHFSECIIELSKDINGSHAVARLLSAARQSNFWEEDGEKNEKVKGKIELINQLLYEKFSENCVDVCKNRQGCCIIQKCLQWAPEPYYSSIIDTVLSNTLKLVHDPFGNYVVQFILDHEKDLSQRAGENHDSTDYTNRIIRQMLHNVASLSCNKFSSNVIEKCLKTATSEVRQLLVDELTDPQVLPKLLTDSFANYVIQTAIATSSDDSQFAQLRDSIMPLQNLLKNSPYGVKVEAKLTRRHRETVRKQGQKTYRSRRGTVLTPSTEQGGPDALLGPQIFSGMHAIPTLVGTDALSQQTMTFSSMPKDVPPVVTQPQYMPLMFQGQQTLFGIHGHSQQSIPVNMMKENTLWGSQPNGIAVFQTPSQRRDERGL